MTMKCKSISYTHEKHKNEEQIIYNSKQIWQKKTKVLMGMSKKQTISKDSREVLRRSCKVLCIQWQGSAHLVGEEGAKD